MIMSKSTELNNVLKGKKTAVALGSFDALHKGHIYVIGKAVKYAKQNGLVSLVQLVEIPSANKVNTLGTRLEVLEAMGVEAVVTEEFTEKFKKLHYRSFVRDFLDKTYNAAAVFCGSNYRFGYMAEGNTDKLYEECQSCGIKTYVTPCVEIDGVVSSTKIREFIKEGKMEKVIEYMGRPYAVSGEVVHGRGLGKIMGFPTANINIPQNMVIPKAGVYATKVTLPDGVFAGITNVGTKPTVNINEMNIETYIKGFDGDLYGKMIKIEFLKRLRDIKKFKSIDELKSRLDEDIKRI